MNDLQFGAAARSDHNRVCLLDPPRRLVDKPIVWPCREYPRRAVSIERESLARPTRQRYVVVLGAVDGSLGGILFVDVHPRRREQAIA
jgi:hypothetical protein